MAGPTSRNTSPTTRDAAGLAKAIEQLAERVRTRVVTDQKKLARFEEAFGDKAKNHHDHPRMRG